MKTTRLLAASGILIGIALATAPAASADVTVPIGPNQYFQGLVNGVHDNANITMVCPGPVVPGQTGHPVAGQTVSVMQVPPSASISGYTGSAATSIVASFTTSSSTTAHFTFIAYGAPQDIPTSIYLPCSGSGALSFTPEPTSGTARSDVVKVTFVNIAA